MINCRTLISLVTNSYHFFFFFLGGGEGRGGAEGGLALASFDISTCTADKFIDITNCVHPFHVELCTLFPAVYHCFFTCNLQYMYTVFLSVHIVSI